MIKNAYTFWLFLEVKKTSIKFFQDRTDAMESIEIKAGAYLLLRNNSFCSVYVTFWGFTLVFRGNKKNLEENWWWRIIKNGENAWCSIFGSILVNNYLRDEGWTYPAGDGLEAVLGVRESRVLTEHHALHAVHRRLESEVIWFKRLFPQKYNYTGIEFNELELGQVQNFILNLHWITFFGASLFYGHL